MAITALLYQKKTMNNKKSVIVIILIIFSGNYAFSQISGISASKLGTYCACPVPLHEIEFEPAFGTSFSRGTWNPQGKYFAYNPANDSNAFSSEFAFRFTYGIFNNMEAGIFIPVSGEMISTGIKYNFPSLKDKFAFMAGVNIPLQSQKKNDNLFTDRDFGSYGAGIIFSSQLCEKSSLDFNIQGQKYFKNLNNGHYSDIFASTDFGFIIFYNLQTVLGVIYKTSIFDNSIENVHLLTINPGITIESAENFILALNYPIDIMGRNVEKSQGFSLALTIMIN